MKDAKKLYRFTSYRDFLRDLYDTRNRKNPSYSMRKFCRDFGFSSPSHLRDVIEGRKNLGKRGARNIMNLLGFDHKEKDYFSALLALDQPTLGKDSKKFQKIKNAAKLDRALKNIAHKPYAQRRIGTVILTLLEQYGEEFKPDPVWVLRRSLLKISPESVKKELNELFRDKVILKNEKGCFLSEHHDDGCLFEGADRISRADQINFLRESADVLSSTQGQQIFAHSNFVLDENDLILLEEKIADFRQRLHAWVCHSSAKKTGGVGVTLNFQLYSITSRKRD